MLRFLLYMYTLLQERKGSEKTRTGAGLQKAKKKLKNPITSLVLGLVVT